MRPLFILVSLALASAAQADTTAIYASPGDVCSMSVKIASNGDVRGEITGSTPGVVPGRAYYFVGGKDYFVDRTDSGSVVMRLEDVEKVSAEQGTKLGFQSFRAPPITLVRSGTVSVNKWSGDAYYVQTPNGQVSSQSLIVISRDPSLAQLGKAMQRQMATSEMMISQITNGHPPKSNIDQVLSSGAPISFAGAELQSVSFDAIPKEEFKLPSAPVPIEQVRKRMIGASGEFSVASSKGQKPVVPCHMVFQG